MGVLGERTKVSTLEPMLTVEVKDKDEVTTADEVRQALSTALKVPLKGEIRMRAGFGGTQIARSRMPERTARKMIALGEVRVGWTVCRIRERIEVDRCHRCQGYGRHVAQCLGIHHSTACAGSVERKGTRRRNARRRAQSASCAPTEE